MATILIVNDDTTNRAVLATLLGRAGHQLLEAADGAAALAVVCAARPDLVIVDILARDGWEFVRQLRADPASAPIQVIFFTAAYLNRAARDRALACGVEHILAKPAAPEVIPRTVTAILDHQQPAPTLSAARHADTFDRQDVRLLIGKLAAQVAELTATNSRLSTLLDLSRRLAAERNPVNLIQISCDAARQIIGAKYAVIDLRSNDQWSSHHFRTSGLSAELIARLDTRPASHELLGKLLAEGRPLRLGDINAAPQMAGLLPPHPPMRSFLGVPIASAIQRYGILYLTEKLGAEEFSAEDEQLVATLASQVAVAYENAQQYDALQSHEAALAREMAERKHVEAERDRLLVEEQLARAAAERAADRTARLQAVTAAFSETLTPEQVAAVVLDQGVALQGARAGLIALLNDERTALEIVREQEYSPDVLAAWQHIPIDTPVPLAEAARIGEPIWLERITPWLAHYPLLADLQSITQTGALVAVPLIAHGRTLGSMGLSFAEERAFDAEERAYILALALQCAQALERAQLYRKVSDTAKRMEEAFALLDTLIRTSPVGVAFVDEDLRFQIINARLAESNGYPSDAHLGRTVRDILPELAPTLEPLMQHVLTTGEPLLNMEISGITPASKGRILHFLINYYPIRGQDGQTLGLGIAVTDITARKHAEERQATQFAVTRIIAESETRYDAIPRLLETICRGAGWDLGELWRVDTEMDLIRWENDWRTSALDGSAFVTTSSSASFPIGIGLTGRVWASAQPEWIDDIGAESTPRAARLVDAGLHSACAFPILGGDTVLGVMGFFCSELRELDTDLLSVTADIGSQIGQFFERMQTEERLWQYTQRLKTLHTIDRAILAAHSPEAIAQAALRDMRDLVPSLRASVTVFDFAAGDATVWTVETSVTSQLPGGLRLPLNQFLDIQTLQQGQLSTIDDLRELPNPTRMHQLLLKNGFRSYISVPIIAQGNLIGTINLSSDRPHAFPQATIDIAREVSNQLALAIQNGRLFEQVRDRGERLRILSQQLVRAQEDERRHIARELHDEVGQSLTAALLNLQTLVDLPDRNTLAARLEDSMALIDHVLQQVRTLSLDLRPALLDDLGLAPALNWLVNRQAERAGFAARFSADHADARFPADLETTCFRVAQEALTNIVRYAQARHVSVALDRHDTDLHLLVRDDGVGFDVSAARRRAARGLSLGLLSMQERVELLGGQLQIESTASGTTIDVCLPLAPPGDEALEEAWV